MNKNKIFTWYVQFEFNILSNPFDKTLFGKSFPDDNTDGHA